MPANPGPGAAAAIALQTGGINNPLDFAIALLEYMGLPVTQGNELALVAWELMEGGQWHNNASFNPLNTTEQWNGSHGMNSVGVQAYGSWQDGIAATAATMNNGLYGDVLAAFQSGDAAHNLASAGTGLRRWSGGGYNSIANLLSTAENEIASGNWGALAPPGSGSITSGTGGFPGDVQQGMSGSDVKLIQGIVGVAQDGIYGPQTRAAVIAWQRAHNLGADGIVGPLTWAAMFPSGGGGGGPGGPGGMQTSSAPVNVDQMVQDQFGYMAWALQVPELKGVLEQAAREGWSQDRLQSALQATAWWQQHASTARQWAQLQATDPATAQRELQQKLTAIELASQRLGFHIDGARIDAMARDALSLGWSDQELNLAILAEANFNQIEQGIQNPQPGVNIGDIASVMAELKAKGSQYFVPMSDQSTYDWTMKMLMSGADPNNAAQDQGYIAYLMGQAKGRYPWLSSQIDQGTTLAQYFEPYKQQAAQLLEVAPDQIDFMNNPQYSRMTDFQDPAGTRRSMTLTEAGTYLRGLPQWQTTQNANQDAGKAALNILETFGAIKQ